MQGYKLLTQQTWVVQTMEASALTHSFYDDQVYSDGHSEIILGKAIKSLNLPRDEIVVMTKVRIRCVSFLTPI